jgi:TRAP-type C4-dicarboxylate transport system substrate-binding protein
VQQDVRAAADKAGLEMRTKARQEVNEAVSAMQKRGLVVNKPSAEQLQEWRDLADKLYPRIRGTMVPAEVFDEVFVHIKAFRAARSK